MNRILGIDFGDKRIGIAVSDVLGFGAHGIGTVINKNSTLYFSKSKLFILLSNDLSIFEFCPINSIRSYLFFSNSSNRTINKILTAGAVIICPVTNDSNTLNTTLIYNIYCVKSSFFLRFIIK